MELLIVVAVLTFLGLAAQTWGSGSRIFNVDPRQPSNTTGLF